MDEGLENNVSPNIGKSAMVTALVIVVIAGIALFLRKPNKARRLPPGPRGIPFLGYLPLFGSNHHVIFNDLAKTYGPIVRTKIGTATVVSLNDYDSIKEGLTNNAINSRVRSLVLSQAKAPGLTTINGHAWRENRQVSMGILRELGWGKTTLEESIKEEIQALLQRLSDLNQHPAYFAKYTLTSISNMIILHLLGVRYKHDDPVRLELDRLLAMSGNSQSSGSQIVFFPEWMYKIAGLLPFTRIYAVKTSLRSLLKFIRKQAAEQKERINSTFSSSYIEAYMKLSKEWLAESGNNTEKERQQTLSNNISRA